MLALVTTGCTQPRGAANGVAATPAPELAAPAVPAWWREAGIPVLATLVEQGVDADRDIACYVSGLRRYDLQAAAEAKRLGKRLGRLLGADQQAAADARAHGREERVQRIVAWRVRLARQIALAYVEVRRLQREVDVRTGLIAQYKDNAEVAQFRREAGLVSAVDGGVARSQEQSSQGELAFAERRLGAAMSELARLAGDTPQGVAGKLGAPGAPSADTLATAVPAGARYATLADDLAREAGLTKALNEARRTVKDARAAYRLGASDIATLYVAEAAATAVSLALVALGVAISTAWLVAQRALLRPIRALAGAATALGAGDRSARADIGRGAAQELRNLGATFTRMGRRLRDRDTELDGMQLQLSASEEHHRLLADASNDMITRFDWEFRRVYVSQACRDLLGYTPDELTGRLPGGLLHPDDAADFAVAFTQPLEAGAAMARASYRGRRKDGQYVWLESSGRRLADGSGYVVVTRDVSERKMLEGRLEDANRQLRILVRQDGLTGLANRRRFDEALGDEYRRASRGKHPLALFMVDVDRFKPFNDTYGHPAGDSCLRAVASVLEGVPRRAGDLAARYGGEEFVILMAETDAAGAMAVAERLCKSVRELGIPHQHGLGGIVTVSVGVVVMQPRPDHAGPAELVEAADTALYAAKAEGRNRVCLSHAVVQPM